MPFKNSIDDAIESNDWMCEVSLLHAIHSNSWCCQMLCWLRNEWNGNGIDTVKHNLDDSNLLSQLNRYRCQIVYDNQEYPRKIQQNFALWVKYRSVCCLFRANWKSTNDRKHGAHMNFSMKKPGRTKLIIRSTSSRSFSNYFRILMVVFVALV